MKPTRMTLVLFVAVLTLPMAALGQDEKTSPAATPNDQSMDNIVVVGQKSLADLRRDVFEAEEDFYAIYNKLNDEKDYDVKCFYEQATGTHIKNHVCRARFVSDAFTKHAARNRNDISRVANQDADPEFAEKTAKYQEKMETFLASSPELEAAFIRYNTARADYFEQREEVASN
jgi:hypothetical protein